MNKRPVYSPEVRERAVGLVLTSEHEHSSRWAAIQSVATKMGCTPETLRSWINKMEVDTGAKPGVTSAQSKRMKALERENRELKRSGVSAPGAVSPPDEAAHKPLDWVPRQFTAARPHPLWVADISPVPIGSGFVHVAFVVDVYSRYIVDWRALKHMKTDLILDAFEQALWLRGKPKGVIHHSDRGSQYLSIGYAERLAEAGFNASVGCTGDAHDNALAETINGLYRAEVIHKNGPWKGLDDVQRATLTWVEWFNHRRLLRPIGDVPPAEYEMLYYQTESNEAA